MLIPVKWFGRYGYLGFNALSAVMWMIGWSPFEAGGHAQCHPKFVPMGRPKAQPLREADMRHNLYENLKGVVAVASVGAVCY